MHEADKYFRSDLGMWNESEESNRQSMHAALKYAPAGVQDHDYVHALSFLTYALLQRAQDDEVSPHIVTTLSLKQLFRNCVGTAANS